MGSLDLHVVVGGFLVDPFTMIDGQTTTLTGTVAPAPKTNLISVVEQGKYIAATGNKGGVFPYLYEEVSAISGDLAVGGGLAPALYRNQVTGAFKDTPLALSFGNPFPASWPLTLTLNVGVSIDVKTPAGPVLAAFVRSGVDRAPIAGLVDPLGPELSAPANATVDGQPLSYLAGGSLTPLIAWETPSLGTASFFVITISDRAKIAPPRPAQIITTAMSGRIPPGILASGHEYNVLVTAYSQAAGVAKRPFAVSYPRHFAETFVALLAP
jgi:hypothetical protein